MRILNREVRKVVRHLPELPLYLWYFLKCCFLFKRPFAFLKSYLRLTPMPGALLELRNGLTILLSGHPHDAATVFLIFVREEYGRIPQAGFVLDVGANIGVFSLYAARHGAKCVLAFEPNSAACDLLRRNVELNHLAAVIIPCQSAVTGETAQAVKFPKAPSMYNAILPPETSSVPYEYVSATSLPRIMASLDHVDLLKLDCEGSEYDILFESDQETLGKIGAVRMEYHRKRQGELRTFFANQGFAEVLWKDLNGVSGTMWYARPE